MILNRFILEGKGKKEEVVPVIPVEEVKKE
jgi:hypothetical protein